MRLAPSEFWEMTPRELWNMCDGYNAKLQREFRNRWEQVRWLGTILANTASKKKIQPIDMINFPWDSETIDRSAEIELIKERRKWAQKQ